MINYTYKMLSYIESILLVLILSMLKTDSYSNQVICIHYADIHYATAKLLKNKSHFGVLYYNR